MKLITRGLIACRAVRCCGAFGFSPSFRGLSIRSSTAIPPILYRQPRFKNIVKHVVERTLLLVESGGKTEHENHDEQDINRAGRSTLNEVQNGSRSHDLVHDYTPRHEHSSALPESPRLKPKMQPDDVESCSPSPPLDILFRSSNFAVVSKPPLMHVHRPEFGSKDKEFVLQKARNQLGQHVYMPHRLDRGTSGCLLVGLSPEASKVLHHALADPDSTKTYVAIVRGSGEAFLDRGWFTVDRPMKDDKKVLKEASTRFLFVRGGDAPDPRCCLVLAQPSTGRFHQIRRHLNGLSHPIIGDSVHGNSRFNREVVRDHAAPPGRLMLHCLRLSLPRLPSPGSDVWGDEVRNEDDDGEGEIFTSSVASQPESSPVSQQIFDYDSKLRKVTGGEKRGRLKTPEHITRKTRDSVDAESLGLGGTSHPDESEDSAIGDVSVSGSQRPSPLTAAVADACGGADLPSRMGEDGGPQGVSDAEHMRDESTEGLVISCPLPDDMMAFLRAMSWWEEGIIEAAADRPGRLSST